MNTDYLRNPYKDAEDKLQFAKVLDKFDAAMRHCITTHTDFYDPVRIAKFMQTLMASSVKNNQVEATSFGGHDSAERMMIVFTPAGTYTPPITTISATYNQRFNRAPSHRDYLGAILSLGLDRGKIGDIRIGGNGAVIYVASDIAHFIAENLTQVGRAAIKCTIGTTIDGIESKSITRRITVPSLRIDAVLSAALNLSRGNAATLFDSERVFANWKHTKKTHIVAVGDTITVRGMGRVVVLAQVAVTKKDRIMLDVEVG